MWLECAALKKAAAWHISRLALCLITNKETEGEYPSKEMVIWLFIIGELTALREGNVME